jgi:predicted tellurium resistance membrane protein TerC
MLEGILAADNALVMAVMVKHLPEKQRKKALFYGLAVPLQQMADRNVKQI